ncbi:PTS sugar transporter subunit IIA [Oceanobacillus sp. J11TS1]|uniref:PTS sugar transporter subunit IIA n=1 Tax=Oceanobacillus sp. J11TS1 TaxID=2807191 RepID=UPI001B22DD1A|nr:PTS sugar transporter subunit IIA [Oceanobacillus sp. J11TS1]GIO21663.1 PTS mannose transporter subunit IIA [Oceanobacillus sp. J11TS1]
MRYLLFASHGGLAEGMLDSVEMVTGKHNNIFTISAYKNERDNLSEQLTTVINQLAENDELIIVTDIFGGSVNNECMKLLTDPRIHLIAGLNLPLAIELAIMNGSKASTSQLIENALKNTKETIKYCNHLLRIGVADEEF